jgi:uncharacterized protein YdaU (DUF1376 family)
MAKDPAVLFYTSDFISGTLTMTDEQRGKYILLLCLQHQKGSLTEKDMLNICKTYDEDIWCKFANIDGKFYNQRMKDETEKRVRYSESRRNNRKNKETEPIEKNISKTYVKHMENENENINEVIDRVKIIAKENFKIVLQSFETWRDYLIKQHNVVLKENEYTYQVLENKLKELGVKRFLAAVEYSIKSTHKQIYEQNINNKQLKHLNQAAKHDSDKF